MESNYLKDDGITWKNVNEAKAKPKKPKPLSLETCRPQISVLGGGGWGDEKELAKETEKM